MTNTAQQNVRRGYMHRNDIAHSYNIPLSHAFFMLA